MNKKQELSWKDQLSEPQKEGLRQIKELRDWMIKDLKIQEDSCWFNQASLKRVTYHTLEALKNKGFLENVYDNVHGDYYRWTGKDVE